MRTHGISFKLTIATYNKGNNVAPTFILVKLFLAKKKKKLNENHTFTNQYLNKVFACFQYRFVLKVLKRLAPLVNIDVCSFHSKIYYNVMGVKLTQ